MYAGNARSDLEPCGGYMVLAGLIENRIIDIRELDNRK